MIVQFQLSPEEAQDKAFIEKRIASEINQKIGTFDFKWLKRSIDARKRTILINATFEVAANGELSDFELDFHPQDVRNKPAVHIIGAGPAGLYAALRAIEIGLRPIVFERGKDVRSRRRDLAQLNKEHLVNAESNYCFGEGGAGTYSDGKLYTRSKKEVMCCAL